LRKDETQAGESRARAIRLLTAHRDQSSSKISGWFPGSGVSLRTVATPSQAFAQWSPVATWTPPPLRGQRRILTGFPILRPVVTKRHLRWH